MSEIQESEMSEGDRIEWLRSRGVRIEFPHEKANETKISLDSSDTIDIKLVKIPCMISEPYSEVSIAVPRPNASSGQLHSDCLLTSNLRKFFTSPIEDIDESALKEANSKTLSSLSGHEIPEMNVEKLKKVLKDDLGSIEAFSLSHPNEKNQFTSVNLYLDEVGQLKHLPKNDRAIALAATCGMANVPLVGDVFIGRLQYSKSGIRNLDFTLEDLNSTSSWLQTIQQDNYEYGIQTNRAIRPEDNIQNAPTIHQTTDGYSWSETEDSIEIIYQPHSDQSISAQDIKITFHSKSIQVKHKDGTILLSLSLYRGIVADESTWTIHDGDIEMTLEKADFGIWGNLLIK